MSAQRFLGKTSKSVLKEVRATLGDDAVIISNRTTSAGVEVLAMAGTEMNDLIDAIDPPKTATAGAPVSARSSGRAEATSKQVQVSFQDYLARTQARGGRPTSAGIDRLAPSGRGARAAAEYESVFAAQMDSPEAMPNEMPPVRVERNLRAPRATLPATAERAPSAADEGWSADAGDFRHQPAPTKSSE